MTRTSRLILSMLPLLALASGPATGQEFTAGSIKVTRAWVPVPPGAAQTAGGYMTITNGGSEPDTLIGGTAAIAGRIEVHEMTLDQGVMRMRELKPGLVIKPGETVVLRPGSLHLMLLDLKESPAVGKPVKGSLVFERAGTIEIEFSVEPFGTRALGEAPSTQPERGSGSGSGSMSPQERK